MIYFLELFIIVAASINSPICCLVRFKESKNNVNLKIDKKVQYKGDKL